MTPEITALQETGRRIRMMRDSYLKKYLHRMAVHCNRAAQSMGRMERIITAYRAAGKQERPRLDREFRQLYTELAKIIGEKEAITSLDHMFNSHKARARTY